MIQYFETHGGRLVTGVCTMCRARFDGLFQTHDPLSNEWRPAAPKAFAASGWLEVSGRWFCGRGCADKHAYATSRGHSPLQPVAVTRLNDASWQKARGSK